jgi:hypothetical protein
MSCILSGYSIVDCSCAGCDVCGVVVVVGTGSANGCGVDFGCGVEDVVALACGVAFAFEVVVVVDCGTRESGGL